MSWTSYGPFHDFSILDPFLDDFLALKSKTLSPFFILSKNCHPEVQRRDVESSSKPSGIVKMKGDGNWFFRGISYALVGDQEQFEETRNMITYWMAQNKKKIDQIFGPD
jgi:IS4 transposase